MAHSKTPFDSHRPPPKGNTMRLAAAALISSVLGAGIATTGLAQTAWQTIYHADFSTNPHWPTNDPNHLRWEFTNLTYHVTLANQSDGIALVPVDYDGQSCRLTYDIKINVCDYSAGATIGLFDPFMNPNIGSYLTTDMSRVDCGRTVSIRSAVQGVPAEGSTCPGWSTGVWYRVTLTYSRATASMQMTLATVPNGVILATTTVPAPAALAPNMDSLGISRRGSGYPGYLVDFELDNITFEVETPCSVDWDLNGVVEVADIFTYLSAWFAGCP